MAKRGKPTGNKRQRERDKIRKREDKDARRKWRKEMRANGFDPDAVDAEGDPIYREWEGIPQRDGDAQGEGDSSGEAPNPGAGDTPQIL